MGDEFVPLQNKIKSMNNNAERIAYLEKYLQDNSEVPISLLARIYQWLGEMHFAEGRNRGIYFEKSASAWEMAAIIEMKTDTLKRDCFRTALQNYKMAAKMYKREGNFGSLTEINEKKESTIEELRKYGGPQKTIGLVTLALIFLASFVLLSGPPTTGFAVYLPPSDDQTTIFGIGLAILGIFGAVFVLWKWR